ncbi:unnamed protein product [Lathyrus oleraceus]|uniref:C2H2-type domain-containing protein n=1 Tax=Pisum sativum TaxID=3888 RepID=A0A9D4XVS3_PEA|nr:histone deacetylase HDT1-like [Pisum sativum]KAI5425611.1 hypothetical protein KIW84_031431 [Pisum sativum]
MEFWGVEVKSGKSLKVDPEENKIIHLSSACLGEVSKDKGNEPVSLYVKFGDKKVQLGTLSSEKFPQTSYDLVFEKAFELSHNWKYGSVFFTGYKFESANVSDDEDEDSDDSDEEDIPINVAANGKHEFEVKSDAKPHVNGTKQKKTSDQIKNEKDVSDQDDEESSESESDSDEDSGEEKPATNGHIGISEDDDDSDEDDDSDDSDEEETLVKAEGSSKRVHESSKKTPVPVKKAKFVTPEKNGGPSGSVHVDTPYPKQALKSANNKQQTPKSNGDYSCKPCNRSFKSEDALGSHNKAKHSAK